MTPDELTRQWEAHLREHKLMSEAHAEDHRQLAEIVEQTATRLEGQLDKTADRLAETVRDTARLHWDNHLLQHQEAQRALDKAAEHVTERIDGVVDQNKADKASGNEWRGSMLDREKQFATKADAGNNAKDIGELQRWRAGAEGKTQGMAPMVAIGLSVVTAIIVAVAVAFVTRGTP